MTNVNAAPTQFPSAQYGDGEASPGNLRLVRARRCWSIPPTPAPAIKESKTQWDRLTIYKQPAPKEKSLNIPTRYQWANALGSSALRNLFLYTDETAVNVIVTLLDQERLASQPLHDARHDRLPMQTSYLLEISRVQHSLELLPGGPKHFDQSAVIEALPDGELREEYGFDTASITIGIESDGQTDGICCLYSAISGLPEIGVWVRPEARGKGVGTALTDAILSEARKQTSWVSWTTMTQNTASNKLATRALCLAQATTQYSTMSASRRGIEIVTNL